MLRTARADASAPAKPRPPAPEDATKLLGRAPNELGERSLFEHPRRFVITPRPSGSSGTPLQDLVGIITPADLHYERHHGGVPTLDPESYSLLIHGMVERPIVFTLRDLTRFPARSLICFLECSGNGGRAYEKIQSELTPQQIDGLTSTSEWTGVPLATLFREVGREAEGDMVPRRRRRTRAVLARSIPIEQGLRRRADRLRTERRALRPEQGYPARLFLPGFEGNTSVKWLRRIELADRPFMTREETSKYTDPLPDGTARHVQLRDGRKSIITYPAFPDKLPDPGWLGDPRHRVERPRPESAASTSAPTAARTWQPAEAAGAGAAEVPHAIPLPVELDRRRDACS